MESPEITRPREFHETIEAVFGCPNTVQTSRKRGCETRPPAAIYDESANKRLCASPPDNGATSSEMPC